MTRIGLIGAGGRMGRAIAQVIAATPDTEIAGGVDRPDAGTNEVALGLQIMAQAAVLAGQCDMLVDFSLPSALLANLAAASASNPPIVLGTTAPATQKHAHTYTQATQDAEHPLDYRHGLVGKRGGKS